MPAAVPRPGGRACEATREGGDVSEACRANQRHCRRRPPRGGRACEATREGGDVSEACRANQRHCRRRPPGAAELARLTRGARRRDRADRPAALAGARTAVVPPGQRPFVRRAARVRRDERRPGPRLRPRPLRRAGRAVRLADRRPVRCRSTPGNCCVGSPTPVCGNPSGIAASPEFCCGRESLPGDATSGPWASPRPVVSMAPLNGSAPLNLGCASDPRFAQSRFTGHPPPALRRCEPRRRAAGLRSAEPVRRRPVRRRPVRR